MSRKNPEKVGRRANVVVGSSAEGVARRDSPLSLLSLGTSLNSLTYTFVVR